MTSLDRVRMTDIVWEPRTLVLPMPPFKNVTSDIMHRFFMLFCPFQVEGMIVIAKNPKGCLHFYLIYF